MYLWWTASISFNGDLNEVIQFIESFYHLVMHAVWVRVSIDANWDVLLPVSCDRACQIVVWQWQQKM